MAPGVNYFAVASIVLANRILMILRPDQNAFEGVKILLDVVYLNTVRKGKKKFFLLWSQVPEFSGFDDLISTWSNPIMMNYDFIASSIQLPFEPMTSYNFVEHSMILPHDDPTRVKIENIIKSVAVK